MIISASYQQRYGVQQCTKSPPHFPMLTHWQRQAQAHAWEKARAQAQAQYSWYCGALPSLTHSQPPPLHSPVLTHDLFDQDKNEDDKELPTPLCAHMTSSMKTRTRTTRNSPHPCAHTWPLLRFLIGPLQVAPPCKCIQSKVVVQPKNIKSLYKNKAENMSLLLKRYNRSDI